MIAYIGVGANLGKRRKNIESAVVFLKKDKKIKLLNKSPLYETEPLGGPKQGKFLNGVLKIETAYSARALLKKLKAVESLSGREKTKLKWSPRTLDLDILFYGSCILKEPGLTIPHPELIKRWFVLKPLLDIAPNFRHPLYKKTLRCLFNEYETRKKH